MKKSLASVRLDKEGAMEQVMERSLEQGTEAPILGLPAHYYRAAEVFGRVRERIFFKSWLFACPSRAATSPSRSTIRTSS